MKDFPNWIIKEGDKVWYPKGNYYGWVVRDPNSNEIAVAYYEDGSLKEHILSEEFLKNEFEPYTGQDLIPRVEVGQIWKNNDEVIRIMCKRLDSNFECFEIYGNTCFGSRSNLSQSFIVKNYELANGRYEEAMDLLLND